MSNTICSTKILIIDDDEATNFLTSYLFKSHKFNCDLSFELSAESALKKLFDCNEDIPDIILLDINLPGLNGWEFLQEYTKQKNYLNKNVAIFMLSTSLFETDKLKSKTYPDVIDYIEKPLDYEKLIRITQFV